MLKSLKILNNNGPIEGIILALKGGLLVWPFVFLWFNLFHADVVRYYMPANCDWGVHLGGRKYVSESVSYASLSFRYACGEEKIYKEVWGAAKEVVKKTSDMGFYSTFFPPFLGVVYLLYLVFFNLIMLKRKKKGPP